VFPFWPTKLIKFDYLHPRAVHPMLRPIVQLSWAGTTLGPGWAMKAERLAAFLDAARTDSLGWFPTIWVASRAIGDHSDIGSAAALMRVARKSGTSRPIAEVEKFGAETTSISSCS
jgi:hypothetical protein